MKRKHSNIYLVGFMGSGKTTVGKEVAQKMNMQFIDLDGLIEEKQGQNIVDIFAQKGKDYFRKLEAEAVKDISMVSNMVVACGGGIVLNRDNINIMEDRGLLVCLDASPEIIYERTKGYTHRPLLNVDNPKEKIEEMIKKRAPFYQQVEKHIDTSDLSVSEVSKKVLNLYKE